MLKDEVSNYFATMAYIHYAKPGLALPRPVFQAVNHDRDKDDRAFNEVLPERGYIQQVHSVVDHPDHEDPDDRTDDGAFTAAQGCTADNNRGDGIELVTRCSGRHGRVEAAGEDYPRDGAGDT